MKKFQTVLTGKILKGSFRSLYLLTIDFFKVFAVLVDPRILSIVVR
jgi:hypothetical protein